MRHLPVEVERHRALACLGQRRLSSLAIVRTALPDRTEANQVVRMACPATGIVTYRAMAGMATRNEEEGRKGSTELWRDLLEHLRQISCGDVVAHGHLADGHQAWRETDLMFAP